MNDFLTIAVIFTTASIVLATTIHVPSEHRLHKERKYLLLLILMGILFRAVLYFSKRSFWLDESLLVLDLMPEEFTSLLSPLKYSQAAPPLFLLTETSLASVLGMSEYAWRLLPFIFGIAGIFLFVKLSKRTLDCKLILPSVFLYCFSYRLIYYSQEVKPYGIDAFFTILLLYSTLRFNPQKATGLKWSFLALLFVLAVWSSFPAYFLLFASSCYILSELIRAQNRRGYGWFVYFICIQIISFLLLYTLFMSEPLHDEKISSYWFGEQTNRLSVIYSIRYFFTIILNVFSYHWYHPVMGYPALTLFCIGLITLGRTRGKGIVLLFTVPFLIAVFTSMICLYPLRDRLTVFLAPILFIPVAAGLNSLIESNRKLFVQGLFPAVLVLTFILPAISSTRRTVQKVVYPDFHSRPLFEEVNERIGYCDDIIIESRLRYPLQIYYPELRKRSIVLGKGENSLGKLESLLSKPDETNKECQKWILITGWSESQVKALKALLQDYGIIEKSLERRGKSSELSVYAFLFSRENPH
jgi:hypothetical protein